MSLILEALKKSEQQRRLGDIPGLTSQQRPSPRRGNGPGWPVLALMLLVLAGGAGAWFWYSQPQDMPVPLAVTGTDTDSDTLPEDGVQELPVEPEPAPMTAATVTPPVRPASDAPVVAAAPQPLLEDPDRPKNERESEAFPADMERLRTTDTSAAIERGSDFANNPDLRRPFEHTPDWDREQDQDHVVETPTAPRAAPAPGAAAPRQTVDSGSGERIPALYELPYAVRRELPVLRLSMHFYSAEADSRFVILNGERQVEGDRITDQIVISEIVTDGVVLDVGGQRALLPRLGS